MSINITVEGGTSKRLLTAGKYCPEDIVVTAAGGAPEDLNAVLTEQEQLIAALQETLRGKAAGEGGGGAGDVPKYAKIIAKPETAVSFTIANPLGGIAKLVKAHRVATNETENRKVKKYIADGDYGIGAVELISTAGIVRYAVTQAEDDDPGNAQFAIFDGVIKLYRHSSANTWDSDSEYVVEIYQSASEVEEVAE